MIANSVDTYGILKRAQLAGLGRTAIGTSAIHDGLTTGGTALDRATAGEFAANAASDVAAGISHQANKLSKLPTGHLLAKVIPHAAKVEAATGAAERYMTPLAKTTGVAALAGNAAQQAFKDPETGGYSVGNTSSPAITKDDTRRYADNVRQGAPQNNNNQKVNYQSTFDMGKNLAGNAENIINNQSKMPETYAEGFAHGTQGLFNPMGAINAAGRAIYTTGSALTAAATAGVNGAGSTGGQHMQDLLTQAKLKLQSVKRSSYEQGFNGIIKSAWIFSTPLGASDVLGARHIPRQIYDATQGGDPRDPKRSTGKSLGLAALAVGSGLFGLGFAGLGMRDLGLKMSIVAKRALQNRPLTLGEQAMAHRMDVPAYRRFGKTMGDTTSIPGVHQAMKATGYAAGGLAHPFNKLEDLITKGVVKTLGNDEALSLADKLHLTSQGQIFDNRAVRAMSSMAALPILMGGDAVLAPYDPLKDEAGDRRKTAEYQQGFMDKLALMTTSEDFLGKRLGTWGGAAAGIGGYMTPGLRTAMPAYDTIAHTANIFAPNQTWTQRGGHALGALTSGAFTALGGLADAATIGTFGLAAPVTSAITGGARALFTGSKLLKPAITAAKPAITAAQPAVTAGKSYLQGTTAWQTAMKNWGRAPGRVGPTPNGFALSPNLPGRAAAVKRVAGRVGASPMTHASVGAIGSSMLRGQDPEDAVAQGAAMGAGSAIGQNIDYSRLPIMARQLGYQAGSYLR